VDKLKHVVRCVLLDPGQRVPDVGDAVMGVPTVLI
jgi:hypothetical protein